VVCRVVLYPRCLQSAVCLAVSMGDVAELQLQYRSTSCVGRTASMIF
jgi:hypothetical protein